MTGVVALSSENGKILREYSKTDVSVAGIIVMPGLQKFRWSIFLLNIMIQSIDHLLIATASLQPKSEPQTQALPQSAPGARLSKFLCLLKMWITSNGHSESVAASPARSGSSCRFDWIFPIVLGIATGFQERPWRFQTLRLMLPLSYRLVMLVDRLRNSSIFAATLCERHASVHHRKYRSTLQIHEAWRESDPASRVWNGRTSYHGQLAWFSRTSGRDWNGVGRCVSPCASSKDDWNAAITSSASKFGDRVFESSQLEHSTSMWMVR